MTEWDGNAMWWQDGVRVMPQEEVVGCPASSASYVAVDGMSTSKASTHMLLASRPRKKPNSAPAKQGPPWFDFVPLQTCVKPTARLKLPCSKKNQEGIDRQAYKDRQIAEARAMRFMQRAAELRSHNHHQKLQLGPEGAIPQEHVVLGDKGKHRPEWCRSSCLFDPITSTSRPVTAPGRTESRAGILSPVKCSASILAFNSPPSKLCSTSGIAAEDDLHAAVTGSSTGEADQACSQHYSPQQTAYGELLVVPRRPGSARTTQGSYNPLTHSWVELPDPDAFAQRQREADRVHGMIGKRMGSKTFSSSSSGSPNKDPASSLNASGTRGCGTSSISTWYHADHVAELWGQPSIQSSSGGGRSGGMEGTVRDSIQRPASAGAIMRKAVRSGDTWGTYDVLRNSWVVPPANNRYATHEIAPSGLGMDRLASAGGLRSMRKVTVPPSYGVFDPIRAEWKVLPERHRAAQSLDFAPRRLFDEKAVVNR